MEITKATRVSDILKTYGDIAEVMEVSGIKRVDNYAARVQLLLAKAITVETAARLQRVPLDEFLTIVRQAVAQSQIKPI